MTQSRTFEKIIEKWLNENPQHLNKQYIDIEVAKAILNKNKDLSKRLLELVTAKNDAIFNKQISKLYNKRGLNHADNSALNETLADLTIAIMPHIDF